MTNKPIMEDIVKLRLKKASYAETNDGKLILMHCMGLEGGYVPHGMKGWHDTAKAFFDHATALERKGADQGVNVFSIHPPQLLCEQQAGAAHGGLPHG